MPRNGSPILLLSTCFDGMEVVPLIHVSLQRLIIIAIDFDVLGLLKPISVYVERINLLGFVLHPEYLSTSKAFVLFEQLVISPHDLMPEFPGDEVLERCGELVVHAFKLRWGEGPM